MNERVIEYVHTLRSENDRLKARLDTMRESCIESLHMVDYWRGMYEAAAGVVDECVEEATGGVE